jgi:hypothetical protein
VTDFLRDIVPGVFKIPAFEGHDGVPSGVMLNCMSIEETISAYLFTFFLESICCDKGTWTCSQNLVAKSLECPYMSRGSLRKVSIFIDCPDIPILLIVASHLGECERDDTESDPK